MRISAECGGARRRGGTMRTRETHRRRAYRLEVIYSTVGLRTGAQEATKGLHITPRDARCTACVDRLE